MLLLLLFMIMVVDVDRHCPITTLNITKRSAHYYYYYYYRKKRFRWRNVKRLQGHLTNSKDSDKTRVRRKVRTEYLSDALVGRAPVEIRKTSDEQFRLQLTSKGR